MVYCRLYPRHNSGSELTPFTVKSQAILSCTQFAIDYRNGSLSAVPLTPFIMSKKKSL